MAGVRAAPGRVITGTKKGTFLPGQLSNGRWPKRHYAGGALAPPV
jgi:hypothetical protein